MNNFENLDYERRICTLDKQEMDNLVDHFTLAFDNPPNRLEMLRNAETAILAYSEYPDLQSLNRYIHGQKRGVLYKDTQYDRRLNHATLFLYMMHSASQQWQDAASEYSFPADSAYLFGTYDLKRGAKDLAMALLYITRKNDVDLQISEAQELHMETDATAESNASIAGSTVHVDAQTAEAAEKEKKLLRQPSFWNSATKVGKVALGIAGVVASILITSKQIPKTSH